jgi:protein SCO1/2
MSTTSPSPVQRSSFYRWPIRIGAVLILAVILFRIFRTDPSTFEQTPPSKELRKLSIVPAFALTERSGKTVTNRELSGKIWVADFIYTTCPGPCPLITANFAKFQDKVKDDPRVMLVSFSVDPTTDTPPVLAKYADQYGADSNRWWFLTGSEKQIDDLIGNGFHLVVQDNSGQPLVDGQFKVTHSTNLALVDGEGNVRGYYDGVG